METTVINATELRVKTREIMERVKYRGERFLVQTFGQPTAIIISLEEFDKLTSNQGSAHKATTNQNNDT